MTLRGLQFAAEFRGRRLPAGRVERHRLLDRRAHVGRDPPGTHVRHGRRTDAQVVRDEVLAGLSLMCGDPGDQRVNRGAEGVHIGPGRRWLSGQHLGRGEGDGARKESGLGFESPGDARDSEVAQLRFTVVVDEHVRGFDIAMQRACPVRGFQRSAQLDADFQRIRPRDRADPTYPVGQGTGRVVGHHYVRPLTLGHSDLQDVHDVRMAGQPAHRVTLTQETLAVIVVEIGRHHLDSYASPERRLVAAEDNARAAPADFDGVHESGGCQLISDPAPQGGRGVVVALAFSGHKGDRPLV